ncbi:primase-helicase family protein [Nitrincola sp.]|uniref:primase-helicase family protein n=1 Tax=Nitrincola sp. TaxID=1926584 RepID=UPI003A94D806
MPAPENDIQNTVKELKEQGYYIRTNRNKSYLYHPASNTELAIEDLVHPSQKAYVFKSLPKINEEVFLPNKNKLILLPGDYYQLNTWKQYSPKSQGSDSCIKLWIEFLERLFPIEEERKQVVQFLAHMIQKPEERPSFALLLTSEQGTGKGVLFSEILYPLLCGQAVQNDNYSTFTSKHSNSLHGTMLCMLDDPKSDHPSTMTKLKSRISESMIQIEPKYEMPRTVPVFTRIMLASNERTPLKLTEKDTRRWYAPGYIKHQSNLVETQVFIKRLLKELDLDTIYNWFMSQSLEGFNHKSPPETETLLAMVERSKPELETELEDFLKDRKVFQWECLKMHLSDSYYDKEIKDFLSREGYQSKRLTLKRKKQTFWYHCDIDSKTIKEAAESYIPYPFSSEDYNTTY